MSDVTDAEVEAALQELLHERNQLGDGCFGCGEGRHWGPTQIHGRIPAYRDMLKRILEAARPHQASVSNSSVQASRQRPRLSEGAYAEGTDD